MRLSSSFSGRSKGDSAPVLALGLEYFDRLDVLANGVLLGGGVRIGFVAGSMVDLVDLGVEVSIVSNAKLRCFWLLDGGRGLGFSSEFGLGGVSWKVFMTLVLSGGLDGGSCLSNQLYHHGKPPARMSARGV